jgi:hypothetical protein
MRLSSLRREKSILFPGTTACVAFKRSNLHDLESYCHSTPDGEHLTYEMSSATGLAIGLNFGCGKTELTIESKKKRRKGKEGEGEGVVGVLVLVEA